MQISVRLSNLIVIPFLLYSVQAAAADITVAATIRPLQLIAQAILQGHGTVEALIGAQDSPHHYALTPGDRLAIEDADLLLWIGPEFEILLSDVYKQKEGDKPVLEVAEIPGLTIHRLNGGQKDPHLWLSIDNAILIGRELASRLSDIEPTYRDSFQSAFDDFELDVWKLESLIEEWLAPFKDKPFLVYHDAFQYFEKQFGLSAGDSLLQDPEIQPSMRELLTIRRRAENLSVSCLLMEQDADMDLVSTIFKNQEPSQEFVDLLGFEIQDGSTAYVDLVISVASSFRKCLKEG